jgi:hypothetical protein
VSQIEDIYLAARDIDLGKVRSLIREIVPEYNPAENMPKPVLHKNTDQPIVLPFLKTGCK